MIYDSAQALTQARPTMAGVQARRLQRLREVIHRATESLPAQGPITVFIHHNTLHSLEDLRFEDAVHEASGRFGCQPYLTEDAYRAALNRGRITIDDVMAILADDLGAAAHDLPGGLAPQVEIRLAMLTHPLRDAPAHELRWFVAETDALRRFPSETPTGRRRQMIDSVRRWTMRLDGARDESARGVDERVREALHELLDPFSRSAADVWNESIWEALTLQALWRVCLRGARTAPLPKGAPDQGRRHRDWLWEATGVDSDLPVNELLTRFCAAFLDQGYAAQTLPGRRLGLWSSFLSLYSRGGGPPEAWRRGLAEELQRIDRAELEPLECIEESLRLLNVPEADWDEYLTATLLALRGWAGMIWQMEQRQDRAVVPAPIGSLTEFLAVRLVLDRLSVAAIARQELNYHGPLSDVRRIARLSQRSRPAASRIEPRAFVLFQLAQSLGWSPIDLARLSKLEWTELFSTIEAFPAIERRRVWHLAFERHYRLQALDALAVHRPRRAAAPSVQVMFCIDEREESIRRHLEEAAPEVETFGAAGFFSIPMYFRGAAEAHFVPLCPIVIRPQHWVAEEPADPGDGDARTRVRRALGRLWHGFHLGSRGFTVGALLAAGVGAVTAFPMVARVLFPRLTAALWRHAGGWVRPPNATTLRLERQAPTPGDHGVHLGFTVDEMAAMAERLLRDLGLTRSFAPLVLILGHGSNSVNNPHKSAYDCGACGGSCGGPNARAAAQILNDPRVRRRLAEHGIAIPADTAFVGGAHNTCNDAIEFFDVDRLPLARVGDFERIVETLDEVCDRNAHERCRRFLSAPLDMTPAAARRHVEGRAEDLAQTRPECGHATNALCIVGRRQRTRGLFLDRRAFLVSYDPTQDGEQLPVLTRILQAIVPVCAGINLEYYFSYVDPAGWGCGTKLPHNVTSLLGIMDGAASDLRTGLPWQMVEIHEPVRLLLALEARPHSVMGLLERNPAIANLVANGWVHLALLDPESSRVHYFEQGEFREHDPAISNLPSSSSSIDWYRGWREHLPFADIAPGAEGND